MKLGDIYRSALELYDRIPERTGRIYERFSDHITENHDSPLLRIPVKMGGLVVGRVADKDFFRYATIAGISTVVGYASSVGANHVIQLLDLPSTVDSWFGSYGGQVVAFLVGAILTKPAMLFMFNPEFYWEGGSRRGKFVRDQLAILWMSLLTHIGCLIFVPYIGKEIVDHGGSIELSQFVNTAVSSGVKLLTQSEGYRRIVK